MLSKALKLKRIYLLIAIAALVSALLFISRTEAATAPPVNTPPGSTLSQRISQRKGERKISLDKVNTIRVQSQCTRSQGVLRALSNDYTDMADARDKVYWGIDAKLWIIIGSLKLIGKDTFKLEQQKLAYDKQVRKFDNAAAQFKQTVSDITAMNCQADPNGFMSLIETARLYNAEIRQSFKDIKNQLVNNVSPVITQHANELKTNKVTE